MNFTADVYLIQLLHGCVYGMLLFLVASGLTLVLGMMGVLNIAHGAFYMLGAYIAYTISLSLHSFWPSLIAVPLIAGIIAFLIERFLLRRTYGFGHNVQLMLTFGLLFIMTETVRLVWGSNPLTLQPPEILSGSVLVAGAKYPVYRLFMLAVSFIVLIGMSILLLRTRIGIMIRASVTNSNMVEALGNNVPRLFAGVFIGGVMLAAFAGVIATPFMSIYPGIANEALLDCFVIIVVGGLGSLLGALVASLMLGQLQSFGVLWLPSLVVVFQFLLMAVVFVFKPTGLFGEKK
jgi:branched-chain amino acid transport system permease protein